MDQKILSELGNYPLAHREDITAEWLRAVEQNPDISSTVHLKDKEELLDHLPEASNSFLSRSAFCSNNRSSASTSVSTVEIGSSRL
jgi:hypothetical protein